MPLTDGSMQSFALTLDKFLEHAAKWHGQAEVVTGRQGRSVARTSYAELDKRARKVTVVLRGFGVRAVNESPGWNTRASRGVVRHRGHGRDLPH
jgi:fatty-acyl-CoA synthase